MPLKRVTERARKDMRQGKSPSSAAGEFVREEMHHIREGKHGAKSAKQAVAIGLSEARRAGIPVADKRAGRTSKGSSRKRSAPKRASSRRPSARRSRAITAALKRMPRRAASHRALSRQAHAASRKRSAASRSAAAKKGARTRARNRSASRAR